MKSGLLNENSGIIKWDLQVDPVANKELMLGYAVKFPSKERVVLKL